jgi:hypothetical protein
VNRVLVGILFLCVAITLASAQSTSTPPAPISGAKNPELIPFNMAFESMLTMICDGPVPQPWPNRGDYMSSSGLTQAQQDVVTIAAVKYVLAANDAVKGWREAKKGPAEGKMDRINAVSLQLKLTVEDLRKSVESELGPDAYQQLVRFIETRVKSGMFL